MIIDIGYRNTVFIFGSQNVPAYEIKGVLKIRPRTPRHNGKVERSHRNDNERFYSFLSFYSLEDLIKQGTQYLKRSNNIPMQVLNYLTPIEMRQKLLTQ